MLSRSILNYLAINTSTGHTKGVKITDVIICLCDSIILIVASFIQICETQALFAHARL
jgi:hypothetical protein